MEPTTVIVTAFVAGAVAAAKDVATQAIKDGYAGLKALILRKFSGKPAATTAVEQVAQKPESGAWQGVLKEELEASGADQDAELVKQAQALLDLLKQQGHDTTTYHAQVIGSGAIAQGPGAVAAGQGGVAIGGNVQGDVTGGKSKGT